MSEENQYKIIKEYSINHDADFPNIEPDGSFQIMSYKSKYTQIKDFTIRDDEDGISLTIKDYSGETWDFYFEDKEIARRTFLTIAKGIIKFKTEDWSYYE